MSRNSGLDQAEGLRRILGAGSARYISFVSAISPTQKNSFLLNMATALVSKGNDLHLLDATQNTNGISSVSPLIKTCLSDLNEENLDNNSALIEYSKGIHICKLTNQPIKELTNNDSFVKKISTTLTALKPDARICLVDTDLEYDCPFVLPELTNSDVVVLATTTAESIKSAYLQIKALHNQLGKRSYYVLILGTSPTKAKLIHQNMSQAAKLYLAVPLISLGSIPNDEYLSRATQLGKNVVEAYPTAASAVAFREIASKLADNTYSISASTG